MSRYSGIAREGLTPVLVMSFAGFHASLMCRILSLRGPR